MNKFPRNPNTLRGVEAITLATVLFLGGTACQSKHDHESMPPTVPAATKIAPPMHPSCTKINVGHVGTDKVQLGLNLSNEEAPGIYQVGSIEYDFGDGTTDKKGNQSAELHAYHPKSHPQAYTVEVEITTELAPGANYEKPKVYSCPPTQVTL